MVFICCVLCNSVTDMRSSLLRYFHPALNSSYRPVASDVFQQRQYCTMRPVNTRRGLPYSGFEHTENQYSTLDERSHRWRNLSNGWHGMGRCDNAWHQAANVHGDSCSSLSNCWDQFGQSSIKRRAQFFSELPFSRHCRCCNIPPGVWSHLTVQVSVCVHGVRLMCIDVWCCAANLTVCIWYFHLLRSTSLLSAYVAPYWLWDCETPIPFQAGQGSQTSA